MPGRPHTQILPWRSAQRKAAQIRRADRAFQSGALPPQPAERRAGRAARLPAPPCTGEGLTGAPRQDRGHRRGALPGRPETPLKARGRGKGPGRGGGWLPARPQRVRARPGRALPPRRRQHYRVEVEHGAHQDEQESDGEDGEVQHGRAGAAAAAAPHPAARRRGRKGRAGGPGTERHGEPAAPAAGLQLHPARGRLPGPLPAAHPELPRAVSAARGLRQPAPGRPPPPRL